MKNFDETIEIGAPAEDVWRILGDPAAAHRYVPGIVSSSMDGSTRICVTADGHEIRETISELSPERRSYRYEHTATPMPIRLSRGRFSVTASGRRSRVRVEAELDALSPDLEPQLAAMMQGGLRATLANLRDLVEKG
jgi:uncharacterized protein YndB with AHSA1/START domain